MKPETIHSAFGKPRRLVTVMRPRGAPLVRTWRKERVGFWRMQAELQGRSAICYGALMELEITLPEEIAVMTLPGMAFFPQALLPLHIFEARYRRMLRDALDSHRLFAVAGLDLGKTGSGFEPPYRVATVGMVRACQERQDGTSNLPCRD